MDNEWSAGGGGAPLNFAYDTLLRLIEHLKACVDVAGTRTQHWQKYCAGGGSRSSSGRGSTFGSSDVATSGVAGYGDETVLPFLLRISFLLDDGVSPIVLQLLQSAVCPVIPQQSTASVHQTTATPQPSKVSSRSGKTSSPSKSLSRYVPCTIKYPTSCSR